MPSSWLDHWSVSAPDTFLHSSGVIFRVVRAAEHVDLIVDHDSLDVVQKKALSDGKTIADIVKGIKTITEESVRFFRYMS